MICAPRRVPKRVTVSGIVSKHARLTKFRWNSRQSCADITIVVSANWCSRSLVSSQPLRFMRNRYRMFRRSGVYCVQDNLSGRQESLRTKRRVDAEKLCHAKNEAAHAFMLNRDLGRVATTCFPLRPPWEPRRKNHRYGPDPRCQERLIRRSIDH